MTNYNIPSDYGLKPEATLFGGHFEVDDSYRTRRPSGMNDWLILFTLSGEGYFRTPDGQHKCTTGDFGMLRSGVPHEYGTVRGANWNFIWVHFQQLPDIGYVPSEEFLVHALPEGYLRKRVYRAFQRILHDSRDQSGYWHDLCDNSIKEILLLIAQRLHKKLDARIEHALQLLSQSMKEEFRVDELAKAVGLSSSRLSHLFKQEIGESLVEHLNRMRLRQAALLMEHMGRTASEAAFDVGFNNYNHFASLFRRIYGVSPRNYVNR
jgi:AraC family transcriptional regulator, arabinose operon regulatory protein